MNRFILLAFALGCAGADNGDLFDYPSDAGELGQTAQALTWPDGYGYTHGPRLRCWAGNPSCDRPKSKTFKFRFLSSTCPSWYQSRVNNAVARWRSILGQRGWSVTVVSSGADHTIGCGTQTGDQAQFFPFNFEGPDAGGDYTYR